MRLMRALFLVALLGTGCVVRARRPVVVATEAPPPPREEVVPVAPGPGYVWVRGHWAWRDRWVWAPGHWEQRRAGRDFIPGHWQQRRDGSWFYVEGHWA